VGTATTSEEEDEGEEVSRGGGGCDENPKLKSLVLVVGGLLLRSRDFGVRLCLLTTPFAFRLVDPLVTRRLGAASPRAELAVQ